MLNMEKVSKTVQKIKNHPCMQLFKMTSYKLNSIDNISPELFSFLVENINNIGFHNGCKMPIAMFLLEVWTVLTSRK